MLAITHFLEGAHGQMDMQAAEAKCERLGGSSRLITRIESCPDRREIDMESWRFD